MTTPWVDRCPAGHASITRHRHAGTYQCRACGATYAGTPYDARTDDLPICGGDDR